MNSNFEIGKVIVANDGKSTCYVVPLISTTNGQYKEPEGFEDALNAVMRKLRGSDYGYERVGECRHDGDPLEPLASMSEDMKPYDSAGTSGSSGHRDPTPNSSASISVEMVGDKWFTNDLLRVLEATIQDTIREYKELRPGARSLQTQVSTSTQSTQ